MSQMLTQANPYDVVPYGQLAFAQTHPDRLATMARMFGLAPPAVATCRVLELGCASGANLIPMAFNLPNATFFGIDLSHKQVQSALTTVDALGLRNIEIRNASILDVDAQWGRFDYVICHGVFSWVETEVQDGIFRIAAENLAPDGVAYVSYNVYPGWHMREMVRHMMRYHAAHFNEAPEQIEQSRALLGFLTSAVDASSPYGQLLGQEVERLRSTSDWYLYHEHLEPTNAPIYFHQFIDRAARAGLQYLSEANVSDMLTALLPPDTASTLERISPDILHLEQYMDFVRNRLFRQTLLCHNALRPKRALSPALLHGLSISSPATTEPSSPDLSAGVKMVFTNGRQRADSALPATKAALAILMEQWPQAVDVDELVATALERSDPFLEEGSADQARGATMSDLFTMATHGMLSLHTHPPRCSRRVSDTPRAHPLAAFQVERGTSVVNAHHQLIELEPLASEVLRLANGERGHTEILDGLVERHQAGALVIREGSELVTSPDAARRVLAEQLDATLRRLLRNALLVD